MAESFETDLLQPVVADGPSKKLNNQIFFGRASITGSRRSSVVSSVASIDFSDLQDSQYDEPPFVEEAFEEFVQKFAAKFKKSSHMKEAFRSYQWIRENPNAISEPHGRTLLHVAADLGEHKVVAAFATCKVDNVRLDVVDRDGNTPLHLAAMKNRTQVIETLLNSGSKALVMINSDNRTPLQISAENCHKESLEVFIKFIQRPDQENQKLVATLTQKTEDTKETLLHLACRTILHKFHHRWKRNGVEGIGLDWDEPDPEPPIFSGFAFSYDENLVEQGGPPAKLVPYHSTIPALKVLLDVFKLRPDLVEDEDADGIKDSPGLILHYFASFNYLEGVEILLQDPFQVDLNLLNRHKVSALWIAAKNNFLNVARTLLSYNADPNVQDPEFRMTPLHFAVENVESGKDSIDATSNFIDELLSRGANPHLKNADGRTAPQLSPKTRNLQIMSKFIDSQTRDWLDIADENGLTLIHYAASCMDDTAILNLIESGASLMTKAQGEVQSFAGDSEQSPLLRSYHWTDDGDRHIAIDSASKQSPVSCLSLALVNKNTKNYFDAITRCDLRKVCTSMKDKDLNEFLCTHIVAATKEVRPDLVRLLFQQVEDKKNLHSILLYSDRNNTEETFRKTALEWAVENNDRLCTMEILHQEYACHESNKVEGLNCLRKQLTGDELLMWTIETFTMFYEKTWIQRNVLPLFCLLPLLISFSSFIYDYYSDFELTFEYYEGGFVIQNFTNESFIEDTSDRVSPVTSGPPFDCSKLVSYNESFLAIPRTVLDLKISFAILRNCIDQMPKLAAVMSPHMAECEDIKRQPNEFRTAFVTNLVCIALPLVIFYVMCARELHFYVIRWLKFLQDRYSLEGYLLKFTGWMFHCLWLFPISLVCAPFFVLYVTVRQVYFKFNHKRAKRKNKFRRQLQKSEYLWGISRIAEAGIESCGQIILQVWLLSSDFNYLSKISFGDMVDKTYNGIIFFLSFSIKPADDIEKSLGKVFMSLLALVFSVVASYRTLKRGALGCTNTVFIILSLMLQIFARIFSIGLFFFAVRSFVYPTVIFLGIHFFLVFLIKFFFEKAKRKNGMLYYLVAVINVLANSLVYVRIIPIEKSVEMKKRILDSVDGTVPSHVYVHMEDHRTFMVQTLFFALVLIENILLASTPLFFEGKYNRAFACLGQATLIQYVGIVIGMSVISWCFHIGYYKCMGHPWSDINGPFMSRHEVKFDFYFYGKERKFLCQRHQDTCCWSIDISDVNSHQTASENGTELQAINS